MRVLLKTHATWISRQDEKMCTLMCVEESGRIIGGIEIGIVVMAIWPYSRVNVGYMIDDHVLSL